MNKLDYYEIGKRIRKCREELGLTQEAAAEQCGISPSFYSNIERGIKVMSLETFVSICQAFSVSADYLLRDELPKNDPILLQSLSEAKKYGGQQYENIPASSGPCCTLLTVSENPPGKEALLPQFFQDAAPV